MKFPTTILTLLLARCFICANADDAQLPKVGGDDPTRAGQSAGTAATGHFYDDNAGSDADADDGESRHRTRMVVPVLTADSSVSDTGKEDQEDHPLHLHRFHRPAMGGKDHSHQASEDDDDALARDVPPIRTHGEEEDYLSKDSQTASSAGAAESHEEGPRHHDEEGADAVPLGGSNAKESKRLWGAAAAATATTTGSGSAAEASVAAAASISAGSSSATAAAATAAAAPTTQQHHHRDEANNHNQTRAFVVPKSKVAKSPPDGFELSARVYIDPRDRLAHFDATPQRIPYWDCGYSGSTTSPLPLKSAYFRHALTGATSWSGTDGKHAVLVVTLSPIAMDLNSGETREFHAGSVILLEDVLLAGHKMRPLATNSREGVSVLFLTLPHQFVHTGREHISLPASFLKPAHRDDPCPNEHESGDSSGSSSLRNETDGVPTGGADDEDSTVSSINLMLDSSGTGLAFWRPRNVRRGLLAVFGLSLSSLAADFLAKTAPLWLAVGVGGTCFVAAGTWAMAVGGDALWMAVELQLERRKLGATSVDANLILEDEAVIA